MGSLEIPCHGSSADENLCFSKAEEGPFSKTAADNSNQGRDSEIDQVSKSKRGSSVVATDCVVDIDNGVDDVRISEVTVERQCRICMLSLDSESGIAIELGCSCKDGMEVAHQYCAETWFRSKGNNICEICNSIAQNVVFPTAVLVPVWVPTYANMPLMPISNEDSSLTDGEFLAGLWIIAVFLIVAVLLILWLMHGDWMQA